MAPGLRGRVVFGNAFGPAEVLSLGQESTCGVRGWVGCWRHGVWDSCACLLAAAMPSGAWHRRGARCLQPRMAAPAPAGGPRPLVCWQRFAPPARAPEPRAPAALPSKRAPGGGLRRAGGGRLPLAPCVRPCRPTFDGAGFGVCDRSSAPPFFFFFLFPSVSLSVEHRAAAAGSRR